MLRARDRKEGRAKRERKERLEGESSNGAELAGLWVLLFRKVPIYSDMVWVFRL